MSTPCMAHLECNVAPTTCPSTARAAAAPHNGSPRVLILDDDPSLQRALTRFLHLQGFTPCVATSIAEAVASAERHHLDAVVLDVGLQDYQSGCHFLAWMRQQEAYISTPAVILTGQAELDADDDALIRRHGAHLSHKTAGLSQLSDDLWRLTGPAADGTERTDVAIDAAAGAPR